MDHLFLNYPKKLGQQGLFNHGGISTRRLTLQRQNSGEVPESFGADAEVGFWFMWHCLSHFAFHYVNHVMIWIWLSSFRDTGAGNLIAI